MKTLTLKLDRVNLTDEQFYNLCLANPDRQLERNSTGDLIVIANLFNFETFCWSQHSAGSTNSY
ncbi:MULTISPECIES: hypothetical protein [Synechocystis]|jgi:hypothetical protein|uniref:Uncharacterized protein n=1 Tax=Synechocystis salina LEGE 00031 TaxID=1828736 RepID=A0ABR9VVA7_9SYNC|nr:MULTISPECIES: hypothetical protein [Synechocystis]MBE9194278.1 hypothetical protein [Synechocystis sp. LEGE 06083]MBE9242092.1 hypothetical protein [Synechocystis salina LEGE 00041]MBE9255290.1 hypothetical protein [Synechocystis salina LEGE 00031]